MDWDFVMLVARTLVPADVGGGQGPGFLVDLANLQWWQTLLAIVSALGLSGAPWITALLANKIQFTSIANRQLLEQRQLHGRELTARDEHHEALMAQERQRYADMERAKNANAEAAERERQGREQATSALLEVADVVKATQHAMTSLLQARSIEQDESNHGT